jgi:hypothetical protein
LEKGYETNKEEKQHRRKEVGTVGYSRDKREQHKEGERENTRRLLLQLDECKMIIPWP